MSEAKPQQEPSMEEILASIRRIISEDDAPEAEGAAPAEAEVPADDVLELTEVADEEEAEAQAEAPAEEAEAPAEEPEGPEEEPEGPEEEPEPAEEEEELSIDDVLNEEIPGDELELLDEDEAPTEQPVPAPAAPEDAGLLANETENAATGSFSTLVEAVNQVHGGGTLGRTVEDLVKEVMRPMVKEWLDENLPSLTERLVRREVERLSRDAEDD